MPGATTTRAAKTQGTARSGPTNQSVLPTITAEERTRFNACAKRISLFSTPQTIGVMSILCGMVAGQTLSVTALAALIGGTEPPVRSACNGLLKRGFIVGKPAAYSVTGEGRKWWARFEPLWEGD
jgi:hypothetical protein